MAQRSGRKPGPHIVPAATRQRIRELLWLATHRKKYQGRQGSVVRLLSSFFSCLARLFRIAASATTHRNPTKKLASQAVLCVLRLGAGRLLRWLAIVNDDPSTAPHAPRASLSEELYDIVSHGGWPTPFLSTAGGGCGHQAHNGGGALCRGPWRWYCCCHWPWRGRGRLASGSTASTSTSWGARASCGPSSELIVRMLAADACLETTGLVVAATDWLGRVAHPKTPGHLSRGPPCQPITRVLVASHV